MKKEIRRYKIKALANKHYKKCTLTDYVIKSKLDKFFITDRGFEKHPDHIKEKKDIIRQNRMGQNL